MMTRCHFFIFLKSSREPSEDDDEASFGSCLQLLTVNQGTPFIGGVELGCSLHRRQMNKKISIDLGVPPMAILGELIMQHESIQFLSVVPRVLTMN